MAFPTNLLLPITIINIFLQKVTYVGWASQQLEQ